MFQLAKIGFGISIPKSDPSIVILNHFLNTMHVSSLLSISSDIDLDHFRMIGIFINESNQTILWFKVGKSPSMSSYA